MGSARKGIDAKQDGQKRRNLSFFTNLFSFLGTLPGLITAAVTLIAALAGIFRVTHGHFPFSASPGGSRPTVTATATGHP